MLEILKRMFIKDDGKNILSSLLIVSVLTIMCMAGSSMVGDIIETAGQNRLLPIYSVETPEKKVALTFDCCPVFEKIYKELKLAICGF